MLRRFTKQMNDMKEKPSSNIHYISHTYEPGKPIELLIRIIGPEGSSYEFTHFNVKVIVPTDYPFKPPKINFITKIYHPNVYYSRGDVCCCTIPTLKDQWSPALTIQKLLELIVKMLKDPVKTLSDCGDQEIIHQFKNNYEEFQKKAIEEALTHGEADGLD